MELAFIDLQGFLYGDNSTFAIKEICIFTKNIKLHEFVKPPFSFNELKGHFKKQAEWLEEYHHGLNWNTGYITLQELQITISPILKGKILLVKGCNKVKWMKDILEDQQIICINVEDINCELQLNKEIRQSQFACKKHKYSNSHCARSNAALIKNWFYSHSNKVKSILLREMK